MKVPSTEPSIIAKNQLGMTVITGVVQAPQAINMPAMQIFIVVVTKYNTEDNKTPRRVNRTGVNGYTTASSGSGTSAVASFPSPTPTSVFNCYDRIVNILHTTTPNFRETSKFHTSIDRIRSKYYNVPYVVSQIIHDKLLVCSRRDMYLCCRTNVAEETVQTMGPQLVSHGIPIIDTLYENAGIWRPSTIVIRRTSSTTHGI